MQREQLIRIKIEADSLDSTIIKVHPDAPEGRALLRSIPELPMSCHLLMDCAYEGDETRQLALDLGFIPVVPPHPNRVEPWRLKKAQYRRRNKIERMFCRLKGFRCIYSRVDRLDLVFIAFIYLALIAEASPP